MEAGTPFLITKNAIRKGNRVKNIPMVGTSIYYFDCMGVLGPGLYISCTSPARRSINVILEQISRSAVELQAFS
jgi:hypothetical protein